MAPAFIPITSLNASEFITKIGSPQTKLQAFPTIMLNSAFQSISKSKKKSGSFPISINLRIAGA